MELRVLGTDLHVADMRARMPFRYGIASMTSAPHLFMRVELEINGREHVGMSADLLPPKWFTKDPATTIADDTRELMQVVTTACDVARAAPRSETVFDLWRHIYQGQAAWGGGWGLPPLLSGFGTSLVERGIIDAFCHAEQLTFGRAVRENRLGIRLGALQPELEGREPREFLPPESVRVIAVRQTIGLADPLTDDEIPTDERLDDGLPQSLEACIHYYGLTHFKVKLWGDESRDFERLRQVARVVDRAIGPQGEYHHTLDGNENFKDVASLRNFWRALSSEPTLGRFLSRLLFVEQPLHRDRAMADDVAAELRAWTDRPPMIIDESDSGLDTARRALEMGYAGTSHKNCKGVFKSLGNACLIAHRRAFDPSGTYLISGEDLCNVGPIALTQDLCVGATLGLDHIERNGHHYFRGLSMYPPEVQAAVLDAHGDLYHLHDQGFVAVEIEGGKMHIGSVVDAPFGSAARFDPSRFTPLADWAADSLA